MACKLFNRTNKNVTIIQCREIIPGRLMFMDIFLFGKKLRIINIYTAQDRVKKIQLFNKLKMLLCVGYYVILCGDFNTITDEQDRISGRLCKIGREGKVLKEIMSEYNMQDTFRIVYPNRIDFTRFDSVYKTRIDRIYVNKKFSIISYKTKML
uniref:Endonuclease/exonuclease/phosphatase domain-containing protein n=1 Tax=Astyanax mexicanus TaxID=7994 RepID=A0A3B1JL75_ASTMX